MLTEAQAQVVIQRIFAAGLLPVVHYYQSRDRVSVEAVQPYDA